MPAVGLLIKTTLLTIAKSLMTEAFFQWAFLWAAEQLVKSTESTMDDELFERIKEQLDGKEEG